MIVVKQRYSGFVGTELAALLRERGIRTVVLVGLTTDVCVSSAARDAACPRIVAGLDLEIPSTLDWKAYCGQLLQEGRAWQTVGTG